MSRRALCSAGSLRLGSPASTLHRRAPTPPRPSRRASLPSRSRYRRNSAAGDGEVSQVPRRPSCDACPGSSTPVEPREQDLRDRQSLRVAPPVLPSEATVSSASTTCTFRGPIPQPACSLSTTLNPPAVQARDRRLSVFLLGGVRLEHAAALGLRSRHGTLLSDCAGARSANWPVSWAHG